MGEGADFRGRRRNREIVCGTVWEREGSIFLWQEVTNTHKTLQTQKRGVSGPWLYISPVSKRQYLKRLHSLQISRLSPIVWPKQIIMRWGRRGVQGHSSQHC